ncbi:hypothetical protein FOC4_h10017416, partial [Fusarium odoratissimum]
MNNADPQSYSDFPWDSLIDTFPFLTNQVYQALSFQLEFFRNMSTMNLPLPEDANAKEKLETILDKAKLINELMSSLAHSSELLIELKNMEHDEMVDARREEVSSMIDEAGENMEKVWELQDLQKHGYRLCSHQLTSRVICHHKALYHSKFQGFTMLLLHYQREIKDTIQYHYTTQCRHTARHQDMARSQHTPSLKQSPYRDEIVYTRKQAPQALMTLRFS